MRNTFGQLFLLTSVVFLFSFFPRPSLSQDEDDIYSENSLNHLGSTDSASRTAEKQKLIKDMPNVNILKLKELFDDANLDFKLTAIDVFEAYGANSIFSYDALESAACDPDLEVQNRAKKILLVKGIKVVPCENSQTSPLPVGSQSEKNPNIEFLFTYVDFDYVTTTLRLNGLKPETKKIVLDMSYAPESIQKVSMEFPQKAVLVKQSNGFCRYEFSYSDLNTQGEVSLKMESASKDNLNFSLAKSTNLSIEGKAVRGFFSRDVFLAKKLEVDFIPRVWSAPGKKIINSIVSEK